ncbi:hypothetical protein ACP275_10G031200 [Erythranthe tilingii]
MAMSMSCMILRRAFSTVAPRAIRTIPSPKTLSAAVSKMDISSYNNAHHFCTDAKKNPLHQKIVSALKTQMKTPKLIAALQKDIPPVPADFPFTIKEFDYEHCSLKLTRELDGETIDVWASIHPRLRNTSNTYEDRLFTESTADIAPRVSLTVDISTVNGKLELRFGVDASSDDIRVTSFLVDEAAPDSDSDSNSNTRVGYYEVKEGSDLQLGFNEFVETRGIEKKYTEFLFKYIVGNYSRRPLVVLEKLENYFNE